MLWCTSVNSASKKEWKRRSRSVKGPFPTRYHWYLDISKNLKVECLTLGRESNFIFELITVSDSLESRVILLFRAGIDVFGKMVTNGLGSSTIHRTVSPWVAHVFFSIKKDGNIKPCFVYQILDKITFKTKYPLPLTKELVDSFLNGGRYTNLEIWITYGNLRASKGDKERLAFLFREGHLATPTMTFEPRCALGYFQYLIREILRR